jgi:V8-like Glu-specific endopeptidase
VTINTGLTVEMENPTDFGNATITFANNPAGLPTVLKIDGTTMPTNTIKGFMPGDIIDLAGVPFKAPITGATVLETNNVLQVVVGGVPYDLQLAPPQNSVGASQGFSGGFVLSADPGGGTDITLVPNKGPVGNTAPVTGYSTSVYPYNCVCFIVSPAANGQFIQSTGFIIGPHTIVTAAHVVLPTVTNPTAFTVSAEGSFSLSPGSIMIFPGDSTGLSGTTGITGAYSIETNNLTGLGSTSQHAKDFAVINVAENLESALGISQFFGLPSGGAYPGGTVNITGYPGQPNNYAPDQVGQFNDIGRVTAGSGVLDENHATDASSAFAFPGNSGGPLWVDNGSLATAVGIVSGPSASNPSLVNDVQLTPKDVSQIQKWENIPVLQVQSSLSVTSGHSVPMGIVVTPPDSDDIVSVTISGLPKFETITAGPGETVTHKGSSYTVTTTTPGASISDLTLQSSFNGTGAPVNSLSVTAHNITPGQTATSSTQNVTVTDPPANANGQTGADESVSVSKGSDTFVFPHNLGDSTISQSDAHHDTIDLQSHFAELAAVAADVHHVGTAVISHDGNNADHVTVADLHAQNFHLV